MSALLGPAFGTPPVKAYPTMLTPNSSRSQQRQQSIQAAYHGSGAEVLSHCARPLVRKEVNGKFGYVIVGIERKGSRCNPHMHSENAVNVFSSLIGDASVRPMIRCTESLA
jgi:hypothetical protein